MATKTSESRTESIESQFIAFIKDRLEKHGLLNLQSLTGHLSSLPSHIRGSYGSSKTSLKKFVKEHPEHFTLDKKENVEIAKISPIENSKPKEVPSAKPLPIAPVTKVAPIPQDKAVGSKDSPTTKEISLTGDLKSVKGRVHRMFEFFGFITIAGPCTISTSIYFDVQSFENGRFKNLNEARLKVGDYIYLNAHVGPENCEAQYRATSVWRPEGSLSEFSDTGSSVTQNDLEFDGKGRIHNLFATYGFIAQSGSVRENVFFHLRIVSLEKDSSSLKDVLKIGDKVRFRAKPSNQKDSPVKWQATSVWLDKKKETKSNNISTNSAVDGNDIYMSSPESSYGSDCENDGDGDDEIEEYKSEELEDTSIQLKISDPVKTLNKPFEIMEPSLPSAISRPKPRVIVNQIGLLSPKSSNLAFIVFGEQYRERALVVSDLVFISGTRVKDFLWEIDNSLKVNFDAMEDSNVSLDCRWKTLIAWTNMKPTIPTYDSITLKGIYEKAQKQHNSLSSITTSESDLKRNSSSHNGSDWVTSIIDNDSNHSITRQLMEQTSLAWPTQLHSKKTITQPNNISASLISSSDTNSPRKTPSPAIPVTEIFNQQLVGMPMSYMPSSLRGKNVSQFPSVSMLSKTDMNNPVSSHIPMMRMNTTNNHELPKLTSRPIENQTFFQPIFTNMSSNENQHVYSLENRVKELTQQIQLLEDLVKHKVSPPQKSLEERSTQTFPSSFSGTINFTKPELNSRACQTMSTGKVMHTDLFHG